jgi:hypothetical protein
VAYGVEHVAHETWIDVTRVLVTIPTYRRPKLVVRAIESALAAATSEVQVEVCVVDNQSPEDISADISSRFGARVRVYRNESNIGALANWSRCKDLARQSDAHLWLLLEDDNYLLPEFMGVGCRALREAPGRSFFHSACEEFDDHGNVALWKRWFVDGGTDGIIPIPREALRGWAFATQIKMSALLLRNTPAVHAAFSFDPAHYWCHDFSALCQLETNLGGGLYCARPLMRYYVNPVSLSTATHAAGVTARGELLRATRANITRVQRAFSFSAEEWSAAARQAPIDRLLLARASLALATTAEVRTVRDALTRELNARASSLPPRWAKAHRLFGRLTWPLSELLGTAVASKYRGDIGSLDYK